MRASSRPGPSEQVLTGVRDRVSAETASRDASPPMWPWSYRVAGAKSTWPAVEVYEAGTLLDVVSSTKLGAMVARGARTVRLDAGGRALAWGRLPVDGDLPVVEFSRGRLRSVRERVTPIQVTSWCWLAIAEGRYDAVTVRSAGGVVRRRLRMSRSCR